MVLIDPRASYNFIDVRFAAKEDLKIKGFEGFRVSKTNKKLNLVNHTMEKFRVWM